MKTGKKEAWTREEEDKLRNYVLEETVSPYLNTGTSANSSRGKGLWTTEEDNKLRYYVEANGPKDWDTMATVLGIGRSGNSCRLRWLNYLSPDIRHEDFTPQEMLIILNLHFQGDGWAKIAKMLPPGRSDNRVKNFWNTQMKKEAKKLNCDVSSQEFLNKMTQILKDRIQAPADHAHSTVVAGAGGGETMATSSFSGGDFHVIPWSAHQEIISDYVCFYSS